MIDCKWKDKCHYLLNRKFCTYLHSIEDIEKVEREFGIIVQSTQPISRERYIDTNPNFYGEDFSAKKRKREDKVTSIISPKSASKYVMEKHVETLEKCMEDLEQEINEKELKIKKIIDEKYDIKKDFKVEIRRMEERLDTSNKNYKYILKKFNDEHELRKSIEAELNSYKLLSNISSNK